VLGRTHSEHLHFIFNGGYFLVGKLIRRKGAYSNQCKKDACYYQFEFHVAHLCSFACLSCAWCVTFLYVFYEKMKMVMLRIVEWLF